MAKIKLTKSELKAQRDGLKRYSRYLPTLQLKKQQLQLVTRQVRDEVATLDTEATAFRESVAAWIAVLSQADAAVLQEVIRVAAWETGVQNVAGVDTPLFESLSFDAPELDLFTTPGWYDDVVDTVRRLAEFALQRRLLEERLAALEAELRVTTQRVNLFDKVKIPEARENIRRIQIYLGDEQTGAVGRAKIAKNKMRALEAAGS